MMKFPRLLFIFFILSLFLPRQSLAWSTKPLTLNQMVTLSHLIFKGQIVDVTREDDAYESGQIVSFVTYVVKPEDCIKGSCKDGKVVVKQLAGGPTTSALTPGQHFLVFYPENSKLGLVAPLGFYQGLMRMTKEGENWKIPALSKRPRLAKDPNFISGSRAATKVLNENDYESFKQIVSGLVEEQR